MAVKPTYAQLEKRVRELEQGETALKRALKSLAENEEPISPETEDALLPEGYLDRLKLSDVIDAKAIQSMMDDFYKLTRMGIAILDSDGNILVSTGWQDICTRFHREHPETRENCLKSDLELSKGVEAGTFRLYRCKNNMWDLATPIMVRGKRLGILYLGQFVFEDETPDPEVYRAQARKYGFDEKSYMEAFDRVPRWKRETVDTVMSFYVKLANLISDLSFSNVSLARSLKERTRIQDALAKARRLESMWSLAAGLAHDYNNLLSMILGNISMAKDDMDPGRDVGGFLDDAEEATLKAKELTHRLMTLSKGSGSCKRLRSVKDSLEVCAGEVSSFSNCICSVSIDPDLWPAEHDSGQLKYAVRNVLENGVEAMPKGGVLSLTAENVAVPKDRCGPDMPGNPGNYLRISIGDQGVGISKAKLAKIFDPYFSTKEMGSPKGTGLGLTITHAIVNRHDGHIAVDSKRGSGTTVHIYLPAKPPDDSGDVAVQPRLERPPTSERPASKPKDQLRVGDPSGPKRILLMDDEEMLRQMTQHMLKRLGYEVVAVKDGNEAILQYERAMASGNRFHAVILDLTVKGGMGGHEAMKALLRMDPHVKAVVSSGYFNDPVMKTYEAYGFCGAMPKPYQKNDLERVLGKVFNA